MLIRLLKGINTLLPENLRLFLLPYYRSMFPGLTNILFMPSLRCNYTCPYCIWQKLTPQRLKDSFHPCEEWRAIFEKLPPAAVTFTGGEPLLYPDLFKLIDSFPRKHVVSSLVSNLSVNIDKLIALKNKDFRIMTSFHPSMTSKEERVETLLKLKKAGFTNITVNFVAYPEYFAQIEEFKRFFESKTGFCFRADTFKDPARPYTEEELVEVRRLKSKGVIPADRSENYNFNDRQEKKCWGGKSYFLMVADGNVYSCMEGYFYTELDAYRGKAAAGDSFYMGNVFDGSFRRAQAVRVCHSPCADICDLELAGVRRRRPASRPGRPV
jgi:MoaA/NifB/PqqE/SkfB family radical SAM enzyme